ncbi:hypothetical protein HIM_04867 [Hirsutella minnesotensis 3608]|uniref:Uncharacterized protein n=1 Tax=Hirsutella minnesotensis 3608 TaxID=1043627 RepID=A0A0F7ZPL5_9HYPO|nr:hypothetical protein HIM_04867 [Hirsutella minnesotensis 3608]
MAKNKKLDENRAKRIEREKAAKEAGGNQAEGKDQQSISDSIHPSRLARNPLLGH